MKTILKSIFALGAAALMAVSCNVENVGTLYDFAEFSPGVSFLLNQVSDTEISDTQANYIITVARRDKVIGSSLEAAVKISASGAAYDLLDSERSHLAAIFIVSGVELVRGEGDVSVSVARAPGSKCPRCWAYSTEIDDVHPVCPKCGKALREEGFSL